MTKRTVGYAGVALVVVAAAIWALLPSALHWAGLHPDYTGPVYSAPGKRALIVTTSHDTLSEPGSSEGRPTGVFASEMTHPYYAFQAAGVTVDVASVDGGDIPIDPQSFWRLVATEEDHRYRNDPAFLEKARHSLAIGDVDIGDYDLIFLAGGWGAAYDLEQSDALAAQISRAYYHDRKPIIGSVCHGALGLTRALDRDGNRLVAGRRMTGVTNRQLEQLGIAYTPRHPETALREAGARFEARSGTLDFLETHVVVDDEARFVTGQNQNSGRETAAAMLQLLADRE